MQYIARTRLRNDLRPLLVILSTCLSAIMKIKKYEYTGTGTETKQRDIVIKLPHHGY